MGMSSGKKQQQATQYVKMNTQTLDIYQNIKIKHKHNQTLIIEPNRKKGTFNQSNTMRKQIENQLKNQSMNNQTLILKEVSKYTA